LCPRKIISNVRLYSTTTVENITKLGEEIGTAIKFAEGVSEAVTAVSGVVGITKTET
jgi:hypothetical protein